MDTDAVGTSFCSVDTVETDEDVFFGFILEDALELDSELAEDALLSLEEDFSMLELVCLEVPLVVVGSLL